MLTNRLPRSRSRSTRFAFLIVAIAALALTLGACSSSSKTATKKADITIKDFSFTATPVAAGATVTVHNGGAATHTVTANKGSFEVSVDPGKTVTFTAPVKAGTYPFHCNIHTQMKSKLIVT